MRHRLVGQCLELSLELRPAHAEGFAHVGDAVVFVAETDFEGVPHLFDECVFFFKLPIIWLLTDCQLLTAKWTKRMLSSWLYRKEKGNVTSPMAKRSFIRSSLFSKGSFQGRLLTAYITLQAHPLSENTNGVHIPNAQATAGLAYKIKVLIYD